LHHSKSNFAFTQAISHLIKAKRVLALDEKGVKTEIK
jgi:hypothetical protein